ncbi:hypothetical protein IMZ11_02635 [Microtetraspora sp. AC03309]|uniref:hypothetical protein n=1 Tax=Microtetraspora sp. AC03309 TaxID=2779376 RepID=UPI001E381318|nr:hypothetical protein [Microtetraspora sp. AC03309]MCC5574536.1 hypothetical protein [Microtetraspora sp. AC03309]
MTVEELLADNKRMRAALEEIAYRTIQRDLNRIAREALGQQSPRATDLVAGEGER